MCNHEWLNEQALLPRQEVAPANESEAVRRPADAIERSSHDGFSREVVESDFFTAADLARGTKSSAHRIHVTIGPATVVQILPTIIEVIMVLTRFGEVQMLVPAKLDRVHRRT